MNYYLQEGTLNDLKTIYPILENEFLAEELKSEAQVNQLLKSGGYKALLLKSGSELIGFACLLEIKTTKMMWIDYIVICKQHRNKGVGTIFMRLILDRAKSSKGIFLEIEIPDSESEATRNEQLNRIKFYKKFGATLMLDQYLLPHEEGAFSMWLYWIPCSTNLNPDTQTVFESISYTFDVIHSDIEHRQSIFYEIINMNEKSSSPN